MAEFLLELFSEEIPARMQARAADDLKRLVTKGLEDAGLSFDSARAFATPRRLALVVDGLPTAQPDVKDERKGPRVDAPEQAFQGFLRSTGLTQDQLEQRELKGSMFWFAVIERQGQATVKVLPTIVKDTISSLSWPKSMRSGWPGPRWVRPLHHVLAVFDGAALEGEVDGIPFVAETRGHRFMSSGPIAAGDFETYRASLRDAHVILDPEQRANIIREGAEKLTSDAGLVADLEPGLVAENAGLTEWPVPMMGAIDAEFMDVPAEALSTAMKAHQKYFTVRTPDGAMAPHFIMVANLAAADGGAAIVAGNERVLRARLADAKFFWDQDCKHTLESRLPRLADIVFHARLGTVNDKAHRIALLAKALAPSIPGADIHDCVRAGLLAKTDLVTGMVGEFAELQGIMGRYYALADGEPEAVADAIAAHYAPAGPNDDCPTAPVSVAVALADKIDTLVGFWAIDEKPTGSKDPYALRRAAIGVIRLVLENGVRVRLTAAFAEALENISKVAKDMTDAAIDADLLDFIADRLKVHLRGAGRRHDRISAVFASSADDDLVRLMARVDALDNFLESDDGANLLVAYRRAANILRIEEKKDGTAYAAPADHVKLADPAETALAKALDKARKATDQALDAEDFPAAMAALAALRGPVDTFFDDVTVNADDADLRVNRLKLLAEIRDTMGQVADFSAIEG